MQEEAPSKEMDCRTGLPRYTFERAHLELGRAPKQLSSAVLASRQRGTLLVEWLSYGARKVDQRYVGRDSLCGPGMRECQSRTVAPLREEVYRHPRWSPSLRWSNVAWLTPPCERLPKWHLPRGAELDRGLFEAIEVQAFVFVCRI